MNKSVTTAKCVLQIETYSIFPTHNAPKTSATTALQEANRYMSLTRHCGVSNVDF